VFSYTYTRCGISRELCQHRTPKLSCVKSREICLQLKLVQTPLNILTLVLFHISKEIIYYCFKTYTLFKVGGTNTPYSEPQTIFKKLKKEFVLYFFGSKAIPHECRLLLRLAVTSYQNIATLSTNLGGVEVWVFFGRHSDLLLCSAITTHGEYTEALLLLRRQHEELCITNSTTTTKKDSCYSEQDRKHNCKFTQLPSIFYRKAKQCLSSEFNL